MRKMACCLFPLLAVTMSVAAQSPQPPTTLRGVLLEQLHTTHDKEDWFVPLNVAVADLTAEQAKWTPPGGGHSVGQLAYHLWYWDTRGLERFKGEKLEPYDGNNNETFTDFDAAQWANLQRKLDEVMTEWEKAVTDADEATLAKNASLIAHIGTHNAYHIGQILYVRKLEGAWDPSKGVK